MARAIAWLGDRYLLARLVKAARYQPVPYWLYRTGQSLWLDNITRELLTKGTLARYVSELSIDGLTSNRTDLRRPPSMRSPLGCLGQ